MEAGDVDAQGGTEGGLLRAFDRLCFFFFFFTASTCKARQKSREDSGRHKPEIVVSIETLSEVEVARRPWALQPTA